MEWISYIEQLKNQKLNYINRTVDMLCLGFGENYIQKDREGREYNVCEFRFHIQCTWRMINCVNGKIAFAKEDIFEPKQKNLEENFEWDKKGNNLFDKKSEQWFQNWKEIYLEKILINERNDCKVYFSNGYILEIFIDSSSDVECWRFIESCPNRNKKHFVITGIDSNVKM